MAALALLIAVGVVVAIVLGVGSSSPPSKASASTSSSTTTVQRRDLVETDTESGTLSYANSHTVYNRLSGTITWLPSVGQAIKPGQALFQVAGHPVILMNGSTPAYRDLGPSDSDGQDILELNRNLVALGFNPGGIVVDDAWQAATTDGVDTLQASLGETETGTLKLGSVVFLPGDQIVSTVSAQLGSQAALRDAAPTPEFVSLTKTGTTPTTRDGTTPTRRRDDDSAEHDSERDAQAQRVTRRPRPHSPRCWPCSRPRRRSSRRPRRSCEPRSRTRRTRAAARRNKSGGSPSSSTTTATQRQQPEQRWQSQLRQRRGWIRHRRPDHQLHPARGDGPA